MYLNSATNAFLSRCMISLISSPMVFRFAQIIFFFFQVILSTLSAETACPEGRPGRMCLPDVAVFTCWFLVVLGFMARQFACSLLKLSSQTTKSFRFVLLV